MMLLSVLLVSMQLMTEAVPITKEAKPVVIDGVQGLLLEVSEYDDPELLDYELSPMEGLPIMSFIHLPKSDPRFQELSLKNANSEEKEAMPDTALELGGIIQDLKTIYTLQTSSGGNHSEKLSKAIHELKNLEASLTPDVRRLLIAIKKPIVLPQSYIITGSKKAIAPTVVNDYIEDGKHADVTASN